MRRIYEIRGTGSAKPALPGFRYRLPVSTAYTVTRLRRAAPPFPPRGRRRARSRGALSERILRCVLFLALCVTKNKQSFRPLKNAHLVAASKHLGSPAALLDTCCLLIELEGVGEQDPAGCCLGERDESREDEDGAPDAGKQVGRS